MEKDKIKDVVLDYLMIESAIFSRDSLKCDISYTDDGLDSLDLITLVMHLEKDYDINISDDEVEEAKTIDGLVNLLHRKIS